jgi:hypothetical protein
MSAVTWATVALLLALGAVTGAARAATVVDAVLAVVNGEVVAASDIALAKALGLFGFAASAAPLDADDVERYVRVALVLEEARRLAIEAPPEAIAGTWRDVEARAGGPGAFAAWREASGIARSWTERAVEGHVRWQRFIELRFVALAFVTPDEIDAEAGGGDAGARARAHDRLRGARADRALAAWLDERARTAAIRRMLAPAARVPLPFTGPP